MFSSFCCLYHFQTTEKIIIFTLDQLTIIMITTSTRRRIPDDVHADWGTEENPEPEGCLETGIRTSGLPLLNPDHERINEQINKRITWNSGLYLYLYQILGFEAAEAGHNSKLKAKLGEVSKPQPWKFFVRGGTSLFCSEISAIFLEIYRLGRPLTEGFCDLGL